MNQELLHASSDYAAIRGADMQRGWQFRIVFGTARAGWLPISIYIDDLKFEFTASGVLNDPVSELAETGVALLRDARVDRTVRIWEEPSWTELRFASEPHHQDVSVELLEREPQQTLCARTFARAEVVEAIAVALARVEEAIPRTGVIDGWNAFPAREMQALREGRSPASLRHAPIRPPWELTSNIPRVAEELALEVGRRHVLHGVAATLVAVDTESDRYLFELATGVDRYAVVRLSWSERAESDARLPETVLFRTWDDWVTGCMIPDARRLASDAP